MFAPALRRAYGSPSRLWITEHREGWVRVLLADDERLLADTVADGLRRLAMAVDVCYDGAAAMERLSVNSYDVAVLDRDMPHRSGDAVCRWPGGEDAGPRRRS